MKKRLVSLLLVAVMVLAMLPAAFAEEAAEPGPIGENLIVNGSFEELGDDGYPTSVGVTGGAFGGMFTVETDAYEGNYAAKVTDTAGVTARFALGTDVAVEAGKTYQFSFKAKGTTESLWTAGSYYDLSAAIVYQTAEGEKWNNNPPASIKLTDDGAEWHTLSYEFVAEYSARLAFYIGCGWAPWTALVDDVALYEYGEIVEEAPAFDPVPVELINPSFEDGMTADAAQGWTYPAWNGAQVHMADGVASDGQKSAQLTYSGDTALEVYVDYKAADMIPGATYKVTADVYGSITKLTDGSAGTVGMAWHPKNANAEWVGSLMSGSSVTPNEDGWQTIEWEVTNPVDSTNPVLRVGFYNVKGTVYVDNLTMTLTAVPEGYEPPVVEPEEPEFEPVAVELVNADFESTVGELNIPGWEASKWAAWAAGGVCGVYDDETTSQWYINGEGNWCLLVHKGAYAYQKVDNLVSGATYKVTSNMLGWSTNTTTLAIEMLNADGAVIDTKSVDAAFGGNGVIAAVELEATLPDNCTSIAIKVSNAEGSAMWSLADDFTLTQLTAGNPTEPEAPEFDPVPIALVNANFEECAHDSDLHGWTLSGIGWGAGNAIGVYDDETISQWAIQGNWCLQVGIGGWVKQQVSGLYSGTYELSALMLGWTTSGAYLEVQMLDSDGAVLDTKRLDAELDYATLKTHQEVKLEVEVPVGCSSMVICVGDASDATSSIYVDEVALTLTVPGEDYVVFEPIPVELKNGSFEISFDGGATAHGWAPSGVGNVSLVTGDATDGNVSCKLENADNVPALHVYNDYWVKGLIPGGTYKIEYDVKGELTWVGETGAEPATNTGVSILPYDHTNTWVEGAKLVGTAQIKATDEWQHTEGLVTLAEGCTRIKIRAEIYNQGGWVMIDNFKLTLVDIPAGVDPYAPTEPGLDDSPKFDPADSVDGVQLVYNPSFEEIDEVTGKAVGYEYYVQYNSADVALPTITLNTDPAYVHSGTNSMRLTALSQIGFVCVAPRVEVVTGATYTVSYWIKGDLAANAYMGLVFGAVENGAYKDMNTYGVIREDLVVTPDAGTWQHVVTTFEAPVERDYVMVYVAIPWVNGDIYVDDVEMYMTKLPKSESVDDKAWMVNGGFEDVTDGVTDGHFFSGDVSVENTEVYEGTNALRLTAPDGCVVMPVSDLVPGGTYRYSFWHKGEGSVNADMALYSSNAQSDATHIKTASKAAAVSDKWTQYFGYVAIPGDAKSAALTIAAAEGTVYVDNVEMTLVSGPDLAEMYPEQVFFYTGEQETGSATTIFYEGYQAEKTVVIDYQLLDGETMLAEQKDVPIVDDKAVFEFDMALLAEEQHAYTVTATVRNKDTGKLRATFTNEIYVWDRPLALNENGEFLDGDYDENGNYVPNGEIFTPVTTFEVPGIRTNASVGNGELKYETLDKLLEGGINTVLYYAAVNADGSLNYDRIVEELDMLHEYGMKALMQIYWGMAPAGAPINIERVAAYIEKLHQHPGIYAWYSSDEPYSNAINDIDSVYPNMIAGYKMIRSIDPVHPVYYTEDRDAFYQYSRYYADIISIDPYPAASQTYETMVGDRSVLMDAALGDTRPVNNILQAFTYQGSRPTDLQLRNMLYQSYLGGSRTVGYWAIQQSRDPIDLFDSEDLWPMIVSFNENEYNILCEQYADGLGEFTARSRGANAWYDLWEADGVSYLAIANRTKGAVTVNVPFDGAADVLELVTQYRAEDTSLTKTANGFNVNLGASQAVLVKISAETEEPAPELAIVTQPVSYEGNIGDTVEFTVEATGEGLTYQWYYLAVGGEAWQKSYSAGATTDTLTVELRAYRDGQAYYCVVTDANGEQVASNAVVMTIKAGEFTIKEHPAAYEGAEGDTATFTVAAEGDNLSYRWEYSNDGGQTWQNSWSDGYATDTLTVQLLAYRNGQQYRCVVSNPKGEQIISDAAVLSLKAGEIKIVAQPENATVAAGETVTFTVVAEGENLKYRWYRSNDGGQTWVETWLSGYNTKELSFVVNAARAATPYKCVITSGSTTVETDPVSVTIG